jgi:hexosaminidase
MVLNYVNRSTQQNMALGKPVMLTTEFSEKYPVGGNKALTDGLKGVNDYHFNWLGFEGPDMIAIVDLGEPKDIRSIQTSFLQDIQSWVFMPVEVSYFGSNDNIKFTLIRSLHAKISGHQQGVVIEDFKADFEPIKDRYIKVVAKNIGTCPPWHPGYGSPAWIFCDEILLR